MANFLEVHPDRAHSAHRAAYRTAPYRVFVGHSLGGITTIDALYTMPETFNAYVAIDPSLWWDNRVLLKQAREQVQQAGARRPDAVRRSGEHDRAWRYDAQRALQLDHPIQQHPRDVQPVGAAVRVQVLPERQPRLGADDRRVRRAAVHLRVVQRVAARRRSSVPTISRSISPRSRRRSATRSIRRRPWWTCIGHVALGRDTTAALKLLEMNATLLSNERERRRLARRRVAGEEGHDEGRRATSRRRSRCAGSQRPKETVQKLKRGP